MRAAIVVVIFLFSVVPVEHAMASGNQYLGPCKQALAYMQKEDGSSADIDSGLCGGFVLGVGRVYQDLKPHLPELAICIPREVIPFQFLKVFVGYLESHPEELHEDELILATRAFRDAWPCEEQ
ncbi:MAG: Rap1a/Tai family immunity protein [Woeseiaceae bacterium]|nr:Rap1a/Tai family immunity protein [Woeseiaceae bacterium]